MVDCNNRLISEGSLVTLKSAKGQLWVVHKGWFAYKGVPIYGWYLSDDRTGEVLPLTEELSMQLVSGSEYNCGGEDDPLPPPCEPCDCYEKKLIFVDSTVPEENETKVIVNPEILPYTKIRIGDCLLGNNGFVAEVSEVEYDKCDLVQVTVIGTGYRILTEKGDIEDLKRDVRDIKIDIANAMHYIGESRVEIVNGGHEDPMIPGYDFNEARYGDFITYGDESFVWDGSMWMSLDDLSYNYIATQAEVEIMLDDVFGEN